MRYLSTFLFLLLSLSVLPAEERVELSLPWYGQTKSESWGNDYIGDSKNIQIYSHGCTITCAAMVVSFHGKKMNPRQINKWLLKNDAYAAGSNDSTGEYFGKVQIIWNRLVEELSELSAYKRYDYRAESADLSLIRQYIDQGIPVIAETRLEGRTYHFVVIHGYEGDDFLIKDPLNEENHYLSDAYNVSDKYGSGASRNIYGLRVYIPSD